MLVTSFRVRENLRFVTRFFIVYLLQIPFSDFVYLGKSHVNYEIWCISENLMFLRDFVNISC